MGSRDKPGNDYGEGGGEGRTREQSSPGLGVREERRVGPVKRPCAAAQAASDTGLDSSSESPAITSTTTSMPVKAPAGPL